MTLLLLLLLLRTASEAAPQTGEACRRGSASLGQCRSAPPPAGRENLTQVHGILRVRFSNVDWHRAPSPKSQASRPKSQASSPKPQASSLNAAAPPFSACMWIESAEVRARLQSSGARRMCDESTLASREAVVAPGVTARPGLASPTRIPWISANGWRFVRYPERKYLYGVPAGNATLAAAEAFAYDIDAALKIDPADVEPLDAMLAFLEGLPARHLPLVADFAVVDDGSAITGEVMNLLARRNLLFQVVKEPSSRFSVNIAIGSAAYPREEAADPSAFALKIRRQLTDERRSLRLYGSEVVIGRLTGDAERIRLHLINYGGREIEGLRVRLRGAYRAGEARLADAGRVPLQDHVVADGATEFSLPRMSAYAVIDLTR